MCLAPVHKASSHQGYALNSFRQNGFVESSFYELFVFTVSLPWVNVEAYNFLNVKCLFGADLFWRSDVCASRSDGGILRWGWGWGRGGQGRLEKVLALSLCGTLRGEEFLFIEVWFGCIWVLSADKFKVSKLSGCIQVTGEYFNYHFFSIVIYCI